MSTAASAALDPEAISCRINFLSIEKRGGGTEVPSDYVGPHIGADGITMDFVTKMIEHFKNQKMIHVKYALMILLAIREVRFLQNMKKTYFL